MAFTNLYVSGLPDGLNDVTFRQLFEAFGTIVSTKYVPERRYGFVRYATPEEAEAVMLKADGFDYNGSKISVRPANDRTAAAGGKGGAQWPAVASGKGGEFSVNHTTAAAAAAAWAGEAPPSDNLYIKGLPAGFTDANLMETFGSYGTVVQTRVVQSQAVNNDPTGESIALVRMGSVEEAQWLCDNLNGNIPVGLSRPITVRFADPPGTKQARQAAGAGGGARYSPYGVATPAPKASWNGGAPSGPPSHHAAPDPNNIGPDGSDLSSLYIKDLPQEASELYLYKVFAPLGAIESCFAVMAPQGTCSGIGFVKYVHAADAATAIALVNGSPLWDGHVLQVSVKKPKRQGAPGAAPGAAAASWDPLSAGSIQPPPPPRLPQTYGA